MKVVIQRVSQAQVAIEEQIVGQIKQGFMVLVGIHQEDTPEDVAYVVGKISKLRVFEDDEGKMNRSIQEIEGNRPSFIEAARPDVAIPLYELFNQQLEAEGIAVATGEFGADMQVSLTNDGPVTIVIDTREK